MDLNKKNLNPGWKKFGLDMKVLNANQIRFVQGWFSERGVKSSLGIVHLDLRLLTKYLGQSIKTIYFSSEE
jgi:hypothetical protein